MKPLLGLADQQRRLRLAIVGDEAQAQVASNGLLRTGTGHDRLGIYRHAYRSRMAEALRDNFERLPRVMGDAAFDALAGAYIAAHPSRHPSIRWYGEQFVAFMEARPQLVPHPALVDLARMEWALRAAFDASDAEPLQVEALRAVAPQAWPSLRLRPVPAARLLPMRWAVEPLWRALQEVDIGQEPELPEPQAGEHLLLVWRRELQTTWRSLDAREAVLLQAVFAGQTFAALCEQAAVDTGEDAAAAAVVGALQGWLADGLLASFDV